MVSGPLPPVPLAAEEFLLEEGSAVYRVFSTVRSVSTFNPAGLPAATRFAFFGDPQVPVLYGAQTEVAAVCESILHDVPIAGGNVGPARYRDKAMGLLRPTRDLKLASFMGVGLRRLGVEASDLTDTDASEYHRTNQWAVAAHTEGWDGIAWMSRKCNSDHAYVLFGDRVGAEDLAQDMTFVRAFSTDDGFDWLSRFCAPLNVQFSSENPNV